MRIAMVFDGLGYGGIERVGANYARMLVDLGHDVTIFNLNPVNKELAHTFPDECEIRESSIPIWAVPDALYTITKKAWGKYLYPGAYLVSKVAFSFKKMAFSLANKREFDVAIAFSGHFRDLSYVAYDAVKAEKKLCWLHGSLADYLLLSYSFANLYQRIGNLCVLSEANEAYALTLFPNLKETARITKIYNPIQLEPMEIDPCLIEQIQQKHRSPLVMVGRFADDKDQETVIRALKRLQDRYELAPHMLFVGDGPTRSHCEAVANELGLSDTVFFLGAKEDVDTYYLAAKIAIHSSPAEGLPTVLLEAMRNGAPVLATKSLPGVPEILGDDEYGLTCSVGDPKDMAEKLFALLTDEALREDYIEKGRKRVKDFSFQAIGDKLEAVLASLQ